MLAPDHDCHFGRHLRHLVANVAPRLAGANDHHPLPRKHVRLLVVFAVDDLALELFLALEFRQARPGVGARAHHEAVERMLQRSVGGWFHVRHVRDFSGDVVHVIVVVRQLHFFEAPRFAFAVKVGEHGGAHFVLRGNKKNTHGTQNDLK